jgi:hypothetical protein
MYMGGITELRTLACSLYAEQSKEEDLIQVN